MIDQEPFDQFVFGRPSIRDYHFNPEDGRLIDDREAINRWLLSRQKALGKIRPKLVVVAASGGGIAAAYWTTRCLCHIEDLVPQFPYHVRIITGASGGMVGAGYYAASLVQGGEDRPCSRLNELVRVVGSDSLTPVLRDMVVGDLPYGLVDWHRDYDRGRALESAWVTNAGPAPESRIGRPFRELAGGEWEGWRPSLIVSPTLAGQGRPLLISNLRLGSLSGGLELFTLIPEAEHLTLATTLRMNAAFPYVTPDVPLPTDPLLVPIDAGYLDNYGVTLATDWIQRHKLWLKKNTSGVALVRIQTYRTEHGEGPSGEALKNYRPTPWTGS